MHFLHLATTLKGGAGIAARRLHAALQAAGHGSTIYTRDRGPAEPDVVNWGTRQSDLASALNKARYRLTTREKYYFRDEDWTIPEVDKLVEQSATLKPDIVIAHYLTGFLDFGTIARIQQATDAPVIFYLMDMAPFTGGCHFAWDCDRYAQGCGDCPALSFGHGPDDQSAKAMRNKRDALARIPHAVVGGSTSLCEQAARSQTFADSDISTILLAIDDAVFHPRDPAPLREEFGIDAARRVLFFGSREKEQSRKGVDVLKRALELFGGQAPQTQLPALLVAGDGPDFKELEQAGFAVHSLGPVDLPTLAKCYAAADAFVSPSIEDSGPMMVNEAVMSGCPVVAFDIGVAKNLIKDGETGFIIERIGDPQLLANQIAELLSWGERQRNHARKSLRHLAERSMSPELQVAAFEAVATRLFERNGKDEGEVRPKQGDISSHS